MSKILVSGSIAYDYIMDFQDEFNKHIMPEKLHTLSVSFFIPALKKVSGGTGHNIAYTLGLLGEKPILLGAVGNDFQPTSRQRELIDYSTILTKSDKITASAYIMTDQKNNQITAFHPGAMDFANEQSIGDFQDNIEYAIVAPNDIPAMLKQLKECANRNIKVFFDPGQAMTFFSDEQLREAINYATYLILNEYEAELLTQKTGFEVVDLQQRCEKIIITLGEKGAKIIDQNSILEIAAIKTENVIDPTGAGDSLRAGLLRGLSLGYSREKSIKMGTLCARYCIQQYGPQIHEFTLHEFSEKYTEFFNESLQIS